MTNKLKKNKNSDYHLNHILKNIKFIKINGLEEDSNFPQLFYFILCEQNRKFL